MAKISVVINTRNEEQNLPNALASVKKLADEIVVVDMESTDKTVEIAKRAGAKVFRHKPTGYVEPARNFAISKTTGDWILILDADEEVPSVLSRELESIAKSEASADYYRLPRKNIIFGRWIQHSRWWPDYNIRFFKKGKVKWTEVIHSVPETEGKGLDLEAKEENAIVHHNYISVSQYIQRLDRYSQIQANEKVKSGYKFDWKDLIRKPVGEFVNRFFAAEGYKDGVHGLALALLQAFSEIVVYIKVWEHEKFKEESLTQKEVAQQILQAQKEIGHWMEKAGIQKRSIVSRVLQKLQ